MPSRPREPRGTPFADYLRVETVGGGILLAATTLALLAANSPLRDAYDSFRRADAGLTVEQWAAEGLLSVFFFVAGLELRRELLTGELRGRRQAALPVAAAVAGMVVPALVFLVVAGSTGGRGWTVPVATDIAFALGVLAVARERYPASLRALLLSLAVVDDLGAIVLVAVVFAHGLAVLPLVGAVAVCGTYAALQRRGLRTAWVYVPLAVAAWALVHAAGVHATVAGVTLGLLTRDPAQRVEHRLQPWSAGLAVPVFAFTAAGLPLTHLGAAATDRVAVAVFAGLVLGKVAGIAGGVALAKRLGAHAPAGVTAYDTLCLGALGGVGFTVSLLLAGLAFDGVPAERAKLAVLAASVVSGLLATALLHWRPASRTSPGRAPAARRSRR